MTSRATTRSLRSTSVLGANRNKTILGISNNENIVKGMPGKASIKGLGLKDASNKVQENKALLGGVKRKAETSLDAGFTKKRSVLGDVTNAIEKTISNGKKEVQKFGMVKKNRAAIENICKPTMSSLAKQQKNNNVKPPVMAQPKTRSLSSATGKLASVVALPKVPCALDEELNSDLSYCEALPSSQENKPSLDSSNYLSAHDTSSEAVAEVEEQEEVVVQEEQVRGHVWPPVPEGVEDYDKECEMDPFAVAIYANDIFNYYKERESVFRIEKYMNKQPEIATVMRAILVDWMVEVQESFELNHETLYLAVKLVDLYLSKVVINRDKLQLVGATALFIACKFDERVPPYVDDFLYICDDAYKRKEIISFEIQMLKTVGFDLGIPLSYRYLRRYARCSKVSMEELTLARFILEMSLMEYELIDSADHCLAAAALLLARHISQPEDSNPWTPTLQHYSGLSVDDIRHLVHVLHGVVSNPHKENLKTIRTKYSHEVFYKVATLPVPDLINL